MAGAVRTLIQRSLWHAVIVGAASALLAVGAGTLAFVAVAAATETPSAAASPPRIGRSSTETYGLDAPRGRWLHLPPVQVAEAPDRPPPAALSMLTDEPIDVPRVPPAATPTEKAPLLALRVDPTEAPPLEPGMRLVVPVSFYYCNVTADGGPAGDGGGFCGVMRDGSTVYEGAAACDYDYLGQLFRIEHDPTGRIYRCADTGSAVRGLHRDIWFESSIEGWEWLRVVGRDAVIEVLP